MSGDIRQPDQKTVKYFDSVAERYSALYQDDTPGSLAFRVRKEHVLDLFDRPGGAVLDVGCGSGVIVEELVARDCRYFGIDPAPNMIDQAKAHYGALERASFSVGFAERIEHPDEFFDAVICMGVFERVGDQAAGLAELCRVLKPGGTLLITLPNRLSPYFLWRDFAFYPVVSLLRAPYYWLRREPRPVTIPGHRLYGARSFGRELERFGCVVSGIEYTGFNPMLPPLESIAPGLAVLAMRRLEALRTTWLRFLGSMLIVKATKR